MPKKKNDQITLADVLEAVNSGFTRMEQRNDQRFSGIETKLGEHDGRFDDQDKRFDDVDSQLQVVNRKLDQTITLTDTHDRQLQTLKH